ncbi:LPXTG cell wall anchor domain-containing protein [Actinophytocola sp.]|uniref:LPXTG cell wall anchor domain-containing protein n=1 Tax=Actinophytocola sp. TaxID=1872138 RepID=UPI0025C6D821|nr:LPXTG cell wall anchor domain-containing protein [Actinophytocola sp.]
MNRLTTLSRTLIVTALATGVVFGFANTATADRNQDDPVSGDERATAHAGNVVARDCSELFEGSTSVTFGTGDTGTDDTNTYLTISGVPDGIDIVGVIVKGGNAYNVYEPGDLGDLPWIDLHSPLVPSGKPAQISHWFACGVESTETTTPPVETTTDTPPTSSEGEQPGSTSSPASSASEDVSPAAEEQELAETGFNGGWLVALGAMLLLGGGALLFTMRTRGARR